MFVVVVLAVAVVDVFVVAVFVVVDSTNLSFMFGQNLVSNRQDIIVVVVVIFGDVDDFIVVAVAIQGWPIWWGMGAPPPQ